jgi:hypothetical protein
MLAVLHFLQADEAEFDRRSRRSSAARTARASEWGHTAIFSDEAGEDADTKTLAGRSSRGGGFGGRSLAGGSTVGGRGRQQQQQQQQQRGGGGGGSRVQLGPDSADPQDLLEPSTARQMVKLAAGTAGAAGAARADGEPEFPRGDDGRCVWCNPRPALLQARQVLRLLSPFLSHLGCLLYPVGVCFIIIQPQHIGLCASVFASSC